MNLELKSLIESTLVTDFYKRSPEVNFRLTLKGGQDYIQPTVGKTWSDTDRQKIKEWVKSGGFNVTFISNAKLSVTYIGGDISMRDLKIFSYKY